jgi:hypothetical protein
VRAWSLLVPVGDPPLSVLYLAAAIVLEICGTTALKLSQGFTQIGPASLMRFGLVLAQQSSPRLESSGSARVRMRGSSYPWL